MCDIDPKKVGTRYKNFRAKPPVDLPIVHFSSACPPVVVCVSLRRGSEAGSGGAGKGA